MLANVILFLALITWLQMSSCFSNLSFNKSIATCISLSIMFVRLGMLNLDKVSYNSVLHDLTYICCRGNKTLS